jgi:hypothetical protein
MNYERGPSGSPVRPPSTRLAVLLRAALAMAMLVVAVLLIQSGWTVAKSAFPRAQIAPPTNQESRDRQDRGLPSTSHAFDDSIIGIGDLFDRV